MLPLSIILRGSGKATEQAAILTKHHICTYRRCIEQRVFQKTKIECCQNDTIAMENY